MQIARDRWRNIRTAPIDGTKVLVYGPHKTDGSYIEVNYYYLGRWTITWMEGYGEPTDWMPLPSGPKKKGK